MLSIKWSVFLVNLLKELFALNNKFEIKNSQNTHMCCRLWITRALSKTVEDFKTVHQKIFEKMTYTKEINLKMHFFHRLQRWQTCWYYLFLIQRQILFYYSINLLKLHYYSCDHTYNLLDMKPDSYGWTTVSLKESHGNIALTVSRVISVHNTLYIKSASEKKKKNIYMSFQGNVFTLRFLYETGTK